MAKQDATGEDLKAAAETAREKGAELYETAREKRRTRVRFAMASMLVTGVLVCYVLVYWYMAVRQA